MVASTVRRPPPWFFIWSSLNRLEGPMSMIERSVSSSLIFPSLGVETISPSQISFPGAAGRDSTAFLPLSWRIITLPLTLTIRPANFRSAASETGRRSRNKVSAHPHSRADHLNERPLLNSFSVINLMVPSAPAAANGSAGTRGFSSTRVQKLVLPLGYAAALPAFIVRILFNFSCVRASGAAGSGLLSAKGVCISGAPNFCGNRVLILGLSGRKPPRT